MNNKDRFGDLEVTRRGGAITGSMPGYWRVAQFAALLNGLIDANVDKIMGPILEANAKVNRLEAELREAKALRRREQREAAAGLLDDWDQEDIQHAVDQIDKAGLI